MKKKKLEKLDIYLIIFSLLSILALVYDILINRIIMAIFMGMCLILNIVSLIINLRTERKRKWIKYQI